MIRQIRTVKQEMRILGIDTCRQHEIFGAIVRGGSYLDGVVRFDLGSTRAEQQLGKDILATRYFPELRALMIHDPGGVLRRTPLEKLVELPVIKVSEPRRILKGYSIFSDHEARMYYQTSLSSTTVSQIINLTWQVGTLPEPARIAHLLAKRAGVSLRAE